MGDADERALYGLDSGMFSSPVHRGKVQNGLHVWSLERSTPDSAMQQFELSIDRSIDRMVFVGLKVRIKEVSKHVS